MGVIKQIGNTSGDKGISHIPNLKLGEARYYPQDNPNIDMKTTRPISLAAFLWIIHRLFPKYTVNLSRDDGKLKTAGIGRIKDGVYTPIIINKGYVCIKEATKECDGRVLYLHDGVVIAYRETYIVN